MCISLVSNDSNNNYSNEKNNDNKYIYIYLYAIILCLRCLMSTEWLASLRFSATNGDAMLTEKMQ